MHGDLGCLLPSDPPLCGPKLIGGPQKIAGSYLGTMSIPESPCHWVGFFLLPLRADPSVHLSVHLPTGSEPDRPADVRLRVRAGAG